MKRVVIGLMSMVGLGLSLILMARSSAGAVSPGLATRVSPPLAGVPSVSPVARATGHDRTAREAWQLAEAECSGQWVSLVSARVDRAGQSSHWAALVVAQNGAVQICEVTHGQVKVVLTGQPTDYAPVTPGWLDSDAVVKLAQRFCPAEHLALGLARAWVAQTSGCQVVIDPVSGEILAGPQ